MISSQLFISILRNTARCFSTSNTLNGPKIAVVLSGSGILDGTDLHEASATLVCLSREEAEVECYAPNMFQTSVKNHTKRVTDEPDYGDNRNMMEESARLTRGNVKPLTELSSKVADAVIFPGGFGAVSSLSDFIIIHNTNMCVDDDVERIITDFHQAKKPIGCSGLAALLLAKALSRHFVRLTIGCEDDGSTRWMYGRNIEGFQPYAIADIIPGMGSVDVLNSMFAIGIEKEVREICVDEKHKIVSTPGNMCDCNLYEIIDGINNMVTTVVKLSK